MGEALTFLNSVVLPTLGSELLALFRTKFLSYWKQEKDYKIKEQYFNEAKRLIGERIDSDQSRPIINLLNAPESLTPFLTGLANSDPQELKGDIDDFFAREIGELNPDALEKAKEVIVEVGLEYLKAHHKEDYLIYKMDSVESEIRNILDQTDARQMRFYLPALLDSVLKTKTQIPNTEIPLSLSFFASGDQHDLDALKDAKNGDSFTISSRDAEEACFIVCNYLQQVQRGAKVFIVQNQETWAALSSECQGAYLLCAFADKTPVFASDSNISVFFTPNENGTYGQTIRLTPRTVRSIEDGLSALGVGSDDAYTFVKDTGGLFSFILARTWKGYYPLYSEFEQRSWLIKFFLLCPSIPVTSFGYEFIELFTGRERAEIHEEMEQLCLGRMPVLVKAEANLYGVERYYVPSLSSLWMKYSNRISERDFFRYLTILFQTAKDDRLPKRSVSDSIGALTLACCQYYPARQGKVDYHVHGFLESLASNVQFVRDDYLHDLAELSPEGVLNYLDEHKKDFISEFREASISIGRNGFPSFTSIISALRRITFYGGSLSKRAFCLMGFFAENSDLSNINYGPKPSETYAELFIPWINDSGLSVSERSQLAEELIQRYPLATKKAIQHGLLARNNCGYGVMLTYRPEVPKTFVLTSDYVTYRSNLIHLLLANATLLDKAELLKLASSFYFSSDEITILLNEIETSLPGMDDDDLLPVLNALRTFVYDNRYFVRKWAIGHENEIARAEDIALNISFTDPLYRSIPLLGMDSNKWVTLNPKPSNQGDHFNANREMQLSAAREEIKSLAKNYSPYTFCQYLKAHGIESDYRTVERLPFISDVFLVDWFNAFGQNGFYDEADVYSARFFSSTDEWESLLKKIHDPNQRARAFLRLGYSVSLERIDSESSEVQEVFWRLCSPDEIARDKFDYVFGQLLLRGHYAKVVSFVHRNLSVVPIDLLVSVLYQAVDADESVMQSEEYELSICLAKAVGYSFKDNSLWRMAALLDMGVGVREPGKRFAIAADYWDSCPEEFAKDASASYRTYAKEETSWTDRVLRESIWQLFSAHYCPCVDAGHLDYNKLKAWSAAVKVNLPKPNEHMFIRLMASCLSCAPKDAASLPCATAVAMYLEMDASKQLRDEYIVAILNKMGMHTVDDGKTLGQMAARFDQGANELDTAGYHSAAIVYKRISKNLREQAEEEFQDGQYIR